MLHIKVKEIRYHIPESWENKRGVRVFFDHEENIFDEFANRNNRPVRDYTSIIREHVAPHVNNEFGGSGSDHLGNYRIVPVLRQFPNQPFHALVDWLPRTAYTLRIPAGRVLKVYDINFEVIVTVEDV